MEVVRCKIDKRDKITKMRDEILKLEDKEIVGDTIKCFILAYKNEQHYDKCCNEQDHDSANAYEIEIELENFEGWIWDNDLQIQEADDYSHNYGHFVTKELLEFEDYFTDKNMLDYILKNNLDIKR